MENSKWLVFLISAASAMVLQGCSHAALNQQIDEKMAQESGINSRSDLHAETGKDIDQAQGLSADQKSQLEALRDSVYAQNDELRAQSLKLRAVLVKEIMADRYNSDEVDLIKERLKKIEDQRLTTVFGAIDQANVILGHQAPLHAHMVYDYFDGGRTSGHD